MNPAPRFPQASPGSPQPPAIPGFLHFQATKILHTASGKQLLDISFQLKKGSLLALYGPSGAGKTTILRILAGLTEPDTGYIKMDDELWLDTGHTSASLTIEQRRAATTRPSGAPIRSRSTMLPTQSRSIGFVFQDFALFPHMTVRQQLEFALPATADRQTIDELLEMMELQELQHRKPALLSGGQQQRTALARAIARRPALLLLDEPLSAVDDEMRFKLQDFIGKAHRFYGLTTILVSHYLPEIFRLSDEVIVLENGKTQRQGPPTRVFLEEKISSKFRTTGEIVDIRPADIVYIISILSANSIVKVIATAAERTGLHVGQKVMIASKAFNPMIMPIT
ncbi:MAG: ATP-binding cassette domain-containing protein [Bacteroidetes bacterium]|nr:ATP-binding cassette domain-containing protein [Bacteroidota bacterium]